MSGGARVPGSPRRGRRRGRSWSRSRSRSPRGRRVDVVDGDDRYRSRSRSRDGVHDDDRRDRAGPPGTSRDRSRDASARRETTTLPPTEPDEPYRTNRRSGFGLGYRPEEDGALRAAFGARPSRASGSRPSARTSRRAFPAAEVDAPPPPPPIRVPDGSYNDASSAYVRTGSLGWRASSGALPSRAETIEGVGDETLAPLAESLRDAREVNRRRKETMALLAREKGSSSGFEALELRRAFSRRVGTRARANERAAGFSETTDGPVATATRNRGVAERARADDRADAETAFAMSANGVHDALAAKAEAYADLTASLSVTQRRLPIASSLETLPEKKQGVLFVSSSPRATEPTLATNLLSVPPPPGYSHRSLDDEKTRAEKRERLIALRNRGRERTTTNA